MTFDLIYVKSAQGSTMSMVVGTDQNFQMIGPFSAKEAGPKIVEAMLTIPALGFATKQDAEEAYVMRHFGNMKCGENMAGLAYPYKLIP